MRVIIFFFVVGFSISCKTIKVVDDNKVLKFVDIENNFKNIQVDSGIELFLSQSSDSIAVYVETSNDFNKQLKISIENETLKLSKIDKNLKKGIRIYLKIKELHKIKASEGAKVIGDDFLYANVLQINSKGGSIIKLKVKAKKIECFATGGSEITLSGSSDVIHFTAKNSSEIKSYHLISDKGSIFSISDSKVKVNVKDEIRIVEKYYGKVYFKGSPKIIK